MFEKKWTVLAASGRCGSVICQMCVLVSADLSGSCTFIGNGVGKTLLHGVEMEK